MNKHKHNKITATALTAILATTITMLVLLNSQVMAQLNLSPQGAPLAPLPPGGLHPPANCCPSSGYATRIIDAINHQMDVQGNHTTGNFIHLLKILNAQNNINCPHPGQPPIGQCFLAPRGSLSTPLPMPPLPHK